MDLLQKRKIHQCIILGNVDRDCGVCQAHHSRGGACCFGLRWTDGDRECEECPHSDDCEEATFRVQQRQNEQALVRPTVPNTPTNYPAVQSYSPIQVSRIVPRTAQQVVQAPISRPTAVTPGEGALVRVAKDSVWNGLEGIFRTFHDFFRSSRWQ